MNEQIDQPVNTPEALSTEEVFKRFGERHAIPKILSGKVYPVAWMSTETIRNAYHGETPFHKADLETTLSEVEDEVDRSIDQEVLVELISALTKGI